ncbi:hypothetical protein HDU97_004344 [Phlyctochytrium planicorne]|nr:hypothetical protein HDU97_004344 [Phlyctochytrium planicorne]
MAKAKLQLQSEADYFHLLSALACDSSKLLRVNFQQDFVLDSDNHLLWDAGLTLTVRSTRDDEPSKTYGGSKSTTIVLKETKVDVNRPYFEVIEREESSIDSKEVDRVLSEGASATGALGELTREILAKFPGISVKCIGSFQTPTRQNQTLPAIDTLSSRDHPLLTQIMPGAFIAPTAIQPITPSPPAWPSNTLPNGSSSANSMSLTSQNVTITSAASASSSRNATPMPHHHAVALQQQQQHSHHHQTQSHQGFISPQRSASLTPVPVSPENPSTIQPSKPGTNGAPLPPPGSTATATASSKNAAMTTSTAPQPHAEVAQVQRKRNREASARYRKRKVEEAQTQQEIIQELRKKIEDLETDNRLLKAQVRLLKQQQFTAGVAAAAAAGVVGVDTGAGGASTAHAGAAAAVRVGGGGSSTSAAVSAVAGLLGMDQSRLS